MIDWKRIKNFNPSEFDCPLKKGSGELEMKDSFIKKLDKARDIAGIPFDITSGYRTAEHNRKVGGVRRSSHLSGYAADIAANTNYKRIKIIIGAVKAGITRIGVASTFIHLDDDPDKNPSLWLYNSNTIFVKIFNKILNNNPEDY